MKGGSKPRHSGFTIVEVLMVLAVTGLMFVTAAVLINGRQRQTEFSQATRALQGQLQQIINDVGVGYYPNNGNFNCTATAGGPSLSSTASGQGTNAGCIFIGKAIQFQVAGSSPEQYKVYSLAGLQQIPGTSTEVSTLAQAKPVVIAPGTASIGSFPDDSVAEKMQYGITTKYLTYNGAPIGAVAFVNFGDTTAVSSVPQVNLVPISNTNLNISPKAMVDAINTNIASSPVNPSGSGVKLCMVSGGTNESGLFTIGNNGRQLTVTLAIKENTTCT